MEFEACEELVVVLLEERISNRFDMKDDRYLSDWQKIDRLLKIQNFQPPIIDQRNPPRDVHNDPPVFVPYATPQHWPKRIITIQPSQSTGGLIGTFRFQSKFAQRLIGMGERDALKVMMNYWPELVSEQPPK